MDIDQAGARFFCVCTKYNHGQPHEVSYTSWYRHLNEATTEEEKQKMHTAKAFGLEALTIPDPPAQASGKLAKRARESADSQRFVGRRKRAKTVQPEQVVYDDPPLPPDDEPPLPPDDELPLPPDDDPPLPPDHDPPLPPDHEPPPIELILARRPRPNIDVDNLAQRAVLQKMKDSMEFVLALKNASLDDPLAKLSDDALDRLRNPPQGPIIIDSPGVRQSISMYLALEHGSQEAYNRMRRATMRNFEGANGAEEILSFYNVEKLIRQHTGVESIDHDMCPESCLAFTGPFAHLESCPMCGSYRWDQAKLRASNGRTKVAAQTFVTIPLGPQLQALYRDPDSARHMRYL
ncbi:hypothetical protein C8R48DRAFT_599867, partial [Suillus tomentosus]